jgi:hypothetical protein
MPASPNTKACCVKAHTYNQDGENLESCHTPSCASGGPDYNCIEIMNEAFSSCLDLSDQPLDHSDVEYFTNGSSFVHQGERLAGYAMVTFHAILKARKLPKRTSVQKAELIAFTHALKLVAGSRQTSTQTLNMPLLL